MNILKRTEGGEIMCDLFGLSCNSADRASISLPIFRRKGHSNRNGWGLAYYDGNRAIVERNAEDINASQRFSELALEAKSNNIIAHLRFATSGTNGTWNVCEENCHPFTKNYLGKDWTFAHNGVVRQALNNPHPESEGETDSEQVFRYIMNNLSEYQARGQIRGIYPGLVKAIKKAFTDYGRNIDFNMLMSDGTNMYIFSHHSNKRMYMLRREKEYGGATLVSTIGLTSEGWKKIPKDRLLVLSKGEVLVLSNNIFGS